jgi:hypothetical protein
MSDWNLHPPTQRKKIPVGMQTSATMAAVVIVSKEVPSLAYTPTKAEAVPMKARITPSNRHATIFRRSRDFFITTFSISSSTRNTGRWYFYNTTLWHNVNIPENPGRIMAEVCPRPYLHRVFKRSALDHPAIQLDAYMANTRGESIYGFVGKIP